MTTEISNGFQHPLGSGVLTEARHDSDGFYVAQNFNEPNSAIGTSGSYHLGEDWNGDGGGNTDLGELVLAVSNGKVTQSGFLNSLGNYVVIKHALPAPLLIDGAYRSEIVSLYGHLQHPSALSVGDLVTKGDLVGYVGSSGAAGGLAHLHFEIRLGTGYVDADGYNPAGAPTGWVDPTAFINAHRTLGSGAGTVSINDEQIVEGDSGSKSVTFTVTRTGGTAAFNVDYTTLDAGATVADNDYAAASGTLSFGDSVNQRTITITVYGDTQDEPDQAFFVLLQNGTNGATTNGAAGVGLIVDDDSPPTNAAPTAVALTNKLSSIIENSSTASRIKIGDIQITDDGLGSNSLSLAGADAAYFEIDGLSLYLKAGVTLDFESKQGYSVAVRVDDASVGSTPDATSATHTLTINNLAETLFSATTIALPLGFENLALTGNGAINGTGNSRANVLTGNSAKNVLNGAGGADTLKGLGGNDVLLWDPNDALLDGGAGNADALRITGANITVNLREIPNNKVLNTERIDLTGSGGNTLKVQLADVLAISSSSDVLRIDGNSGDKVYRGAGWVKGANEFIDGTFYRSFTQGSAKLLIDIEITNYL